MLGKSLMDAFGHPDTFVPETFESQRQHKLKVSYQTRITNSHSLSSDTSVINAYSQYALISEFGLWLVQDTLIELGPSHAKSSHLQVTTRPDL